MHIHILGICGKFMAGLAAIAKQQGHEVSGCDQGVYPPMSTQLESLGINLYQGYESLQCHPDLIIIGNAMSRGIPVVEEVLAKNLPYLSGPQWLYENVLMDRWVLAVSGTHGKTTTTSMLAWILQYANLEPGFLIGGVAKNFSQSARLGKSPFFVIEADEYDSAFFDKRSKFMHYHPRTLILNNLELDHLDIFENLQSIQKQFHHLIRTIPNNGLVICPDDEPNITEVLEQGCWTPTENFSLSNGQWHAENISPGGKSFQIMLNNKLIGEINWNQIGLHNIQNALAAMAAARHAGVTPEISIEALNQFSGVKRRMEWLGEANDMDFYDDFAHHPTAIATTLSGFKDQIVDKKLVAILECGSYTMRHGHHQDELLDALEAADKAIILRPDSNQWDIDELAEQSDGKITIADDVDDLIAQLKNILNPTDQVLIMSNTGRSGLHEGIKQGFGF